MAKVRPAGRPRSFDESEALDRAMRVFWQKGYEGTSTHDLTVVMGIQPGSLYGTFGNKEELFRRVLARYLAGPVAFMHKALQEPTAYAVAERILRESAVFLTRRQTPRGCMTIQAAMVGGAQAESVRRKLTRLRVKEERALRERFERAKKEQDLPDDCDAADLARFVTCVFQGMTVQSVNGAKRKQLLRTADMALRNWPK